MSLLTIEQTIALCRCLHAARSHAKAGHCTICPCTKYRFLDK
jgi:hypothetical protein